MANRIPLSEVAEITGGYAFKGTDLGSIGYCVVKIAEISPPRIALDNCERIEPEKVRGLERFRLNNGDILMAMTGATTGKVGRLWCPEPVYLNQRVAKILARAGRAFDDFVWAVVSQPGFDQKVLANSHGSAQPNVSAGGIGRIEIVELLPAHQIAIGGIARALDDKIEQNRRTARALERLARAIFRAWFVDFEPVKAKATGATSFPSMPQQVFDALPTRLVDSDIGAVPEGWEVKAIGDVVTAKGGGTPSTKNPEYWDGGEHCWATPKDMSRLSHPVLLDTERRITDAGVNNISSGILPVGTVLLSSRAPVGYLAIAGVPTAINQGFIAMICDGPLPPTFVLNWAFTSMEAIKAHASGTTFPEISKKNFRPLPVVEPTDDVIAAYRQNADPLFDLITACVKENAKLAGMRDYILPRLLSGNVMVRL